MQIRMNFNNEIKTQSIKENRFFGAKQCFHRAGHIMLTRLLNNNQDRNDMGIPQLKTSTSTNHEESLRPG